MPQRYSPEPNQRRVLPSCWRREGSVSKVLIARQVSSSMIAGHWALLSGASVESALAEQPSVPRPDQDVAEPHVYLGSLVTDLCHSTRTRRARVRAEKILDSPAQGLTSKAASLPGG
jgi:hypothetical protein